MKTIFLIFIVVFIKNSISYNLHLHDTTFINTILHEMIENEIEDKQIFTIYHKLFKKNKEYSLYSQELQETKEMKETEESKSRFKIFKENLDYIKQTNKQNNTFILGLNQFADLTD